MVVRREIGGCRLETGAVKSSTMSREFILVLYAKLADQIMYLTKASKELLATLSGRRLCTASRDGLRVLA